MAGLLWETLVKLTKWAVINVVVSMLPFVSAAVWLWFHRRIDDVLTPWKHGALLWPHGELFIVSTAIGADAVVGLAWAPMPGAPTWLKWPSGVGCAILVVLSFGWYGMVQADSTYNIARVIEASQWILIITLVVSIFCKALSES